MSTDLEVQAQEDQLSGKQLFARSVARWSTHLVFWLLGLASTLERRMKFSGGRQTTNKRQRHLL